MGPGCVLFWSLFGTGQGEEEDAQCSFERLRLTGFDVALFLFKAGATFVRGRLWPQALGLARLWPSVHGLKMADVTPFLEWVTSI